MARSRHSRSECQPSLGFSLNSNVVRSYSRESPLAGLSSVAACASLGRLWIAGPPTIWVLKNRIMKPIEVDDTTFRSLALAARARNVTIGEIVAWLVREVSLKIDDQPVSPHANDGVRVYVRYRGERVEGRFDPVKKRLTLTSGPLAGKSFNSPSAAAVAVVSALNQNRECPNTDGWRFWRIADTNEPIDVLRRGR